MKNYLILTLIIFVVSSILFLKNQSPTVDKRQSLTVVSREISSTTKYRRSEWKHWIRRRGSCFNLRHEILRDRSLTAPLTGKKKSFCYVSSGEWNDYYYPEKIYSPKDIDIDHLVPLKHAHDIGGKSWSLELKQRFANDPENLVITNKRYNRKKKDKSISRWLPSNIEYACRYYKDWMYIKNKYSLPISNTEKNAVDQKYCRDFK